MAIQLITKEEKFTAEIEGCSFFYRRLPPDVKEKINKANTNRGVLNESAAADEGFAYCMIGWAGVVDGAGEPAEFSSEALKYLPDPVKVKLVASIFGSLGGEQVEGGNPFAI